MTDEDRFADLLAEVRARAAADAVPPPPPDLGIPGLRIERITLPIDVPGGRVGTEGAGAWHGRLAPPADEATVAAAEAALGVTFPPLRRRLYTEVANGGFGPGATGIGLAGGRPDDDGQTVLDVHADLLDVPEIGPDWPAHLVPVFRLDLACYGCVDTRDPAGPVVELDFDALDLDEPSSWDDALTLVAPSLESWLRAWLDRG